MPDERPASFHALVLRNAALFGVALLSVQGAAYALQLFAAAQLDAAGFSRVRVAESLVAVLSLVGTAGIPSALIPAVASARTRLDRAVILRVGLSAIAILAGAVGALCALGVRLHLVARPNGFTLAAVLLLAGLVALRLALVNATQAAEDFALLAAVAVASGLAALGAYAVSRRLGVSATTAWLGSRLALEALVCGGLLANQAIRQYREGRERVASAVWRARARALLAAAFPVGASLLIRALLDHGPVLWLTRIGAPRVSVAETGVLLTLVTVALMPATMLQGALLPRLSTLLASEAPSGVALRRVAVLFAGSAVLALAAFACAAGGARAVVPWATFIRPAIVASGALILVAKATSNACGGYLLAAGHGRVILFLNAVALGAALAAALLLRAMAGPSVPTPAVLWAAAAIEVIALGLYLPAAIGVHRAGAARGGKARAPLDRAAAGRAAPGGVGLNP